MARLTNHSPRPHKTHKESVELIKRQFFGKDIVSMTQFSLSSLSALFAATKTMANAVRHEKNLKLLDGKVITLLFYEPSSRTFGSFAAAVKLLGGQTLDIQDPQHSSSVSKGEILEDTIRVFESYSDCIIIRHPIAGTAQKAAQAAQFIPVINAGDGIGEHPTQGLLDLYTIYSKFHKLHNLTGVVAGDLLNGRTVHSLLEGLSMYKNNIMYLLSPKELKLSKKDFVRFTQRGINLVEIASENDLPKNAHFWYWTRVQKERFKTMSEYEKVKNKFIVTASLLDAYGNPNMILMHPLPRVGEIDPKVDNDPRAVYLRSEIRNGLYIRMALLSLILTP